MKRSDLKLTTLPSGTRHHLIKDLICETYYHMVENRQYTDTFRMEEMLDLKESIKYEERRTYKRLTQPLIELSEQITTYPITLEDIEGRSWKLLYFLEKYIERYVCCTKTVRVKLDLLLLKMKEEYPY